MEEESPVPAVECSSLYFSFNKKKDGCILNGVNIKVNEGVIYGLLGPSGCGKTTLLRCIANRYKPSSGTVKIFGKLHGQEGVNIPGPGLGYMPQELALYPEITTEETLTYFGRLYQMDSTTIKDRITFLTDLIEIPDKKKQIKYLSSGQQRRVSFAVALIHKPPLVILDEPTVGVDPLLRQRIWNHLQKLAAIDFTTIIITTHYVEEARQAQFVGFMRQGRILSEANPESLIIQNNASTLEEVFLKRCLEDTKDASPLRRCKDSERQDNFCVLQKVQTLNDTSNTSMNFNTETTNRTKGKPTKSESTLTILNNSFEYDVKNSKCVKNSTWGKRQQSSGHRMKALISKNFLRLKRNLPLVFFHVMIPTIQAMLFCMCLGREPYNLSLAVVNLDTNPLGLSVTFLNSIDNRTIHQKPYLNLSIAIESVKTAENWGALYIGPFFTESMINRYKQCMEASNETIKNSTIKLYLDMTNQQVAATIYSHILTSFLKYAEDSIIQLDGNALLTTLPVVLEEPIYGDKSTDLTTFLAPGMVLGMTYFAAMGLSCMSIILEKKQGLLDRSIIAGVYSWEVIISILVTHIFVMIFQVALILVVTFGIFSIPIKGPIVMLTITCILVGMEGMCFGLLVSALSNDENFAMMMVIGTFFTYTILSGMMWPLEAMPYYVKQFSYCLPMTIITDNFRSILSRGWSIIDHDMWIGYLVTFAWIIPVIVVSSFIFRIKK